MQCCDHQMTIWQLVEELAKYPETYSVYYDFPSVMPGPIASYRGDYADAALGVRITSQVGFGTVGALLKELKNCLYKPYQGYKGGSYTFRRSTPLWVANPGEAGGQFITEVRHESDTFNWVTLITMNENDED